jgi:predicted DNA-binding antitoxin AbrB/MazE fold protein
MMTNPVTMSETITAVYENGLLRPLTPLALPEQSRVRLRIETEKTDERGSVFDLIGLFSSDKPLIDGIPVSQDPDLYLLAEALGTRADELHAWEIAPQRYRRGDDGQAILYGVS